MHSPSSRADRQATARRSRLVGYDGRSMPSSPKSARRCTWAQGHPLMGAYHDEEWGVPVHDDHMWYEKILLDGAQAGLSWLTILKKREAYREAFCDFDPARVARFAARDL